ncbi:MAG: FHA domain-containing protein, partial [Schleiferiaceae bacterium]
MNKPFHPCSHHGGSEEGVTVEDLGSTNGTEVDGKPVDGPILVGGRARV